MFRKSLCAPGGHSGTDTLVVTQPLCLFVTRAKSLKPDTGESIKLRAARSP